MKYAWIFLAALFYLLNGCAETQQRGTQSTYSEAVVRYPSSEPHVLNGAVHDYGQRISQGGPGLSAQYLPPSLQDVPTHCNNLPQNLIGYCQLAMQFQITMEDAIMIDGASGGESTSKLCGFKLTDEFEMLKNGIFFSEQKKQAYIFLLNSFDKGRINNIRVWCKQSYDRYGPNAPVFPNGVSFKWFK